jgi:hypothetical protein
MRESAFLKRLAGAVVVAVCLGAAPAFADTVFSDSTFDLSGYTASPQYINGADASIAGTQCSSCGNPGSALQITANFGTANDAVAQGFINNSFVYNPLTSGAITGIDFSVDKNLVFSQPATPPGMLFGNSARPTIEQDGVYYVAVIPGPGTAGGGVPTGFNTFTADLVATDFLAYNFATNAFGTTNPNFDGDPLSFGLTQSFGLGFTAPTTAVATYDNLSFDIASSLPPVAAPEPSSIAMLCVGLASMLLFGLFRRNKSISQE